MPPEAVVRCLKSEKTAESLQMQMILQSAPVLKKHENFQHVYDSCRFWPVCLFLSVSDRNPISLPLQKRAAGSHPALP